MSACQQGGPVVRDARPSAGQPRVKTSASTDILPAEMPLSETSNRCQLQGLCSVADHFRLRLVVS